MGQETSLHTLDHKMASESHMAVTGILDSSMSCLIMVSGCTLLEGMRIESSKIDEMWGPHI